MTNYFISPMPSFYRVNLYNKLASETQFKVIYLTKYNAEKRSNDFLKSNHYYQNKIMHNYSLIGKILFILKIIRTSNKKKIFVCGWDNIIYWIIIFFSNNTKLFFICDNFESKNKNFILNFARKIFLQKIDVALVPGQPHKEYLKKLNFKKKIIVTGSVGIINNPDEKFKKIKNIKNIIYIGRITAEKNIKFILSFFKKNISYNLDIFGPTNKIFYDKKFSKNINFYGSILNFKIPKIIKKYDALILPSKFEPWGLVVEEAIFNKIPVIVSNKVGCNIDLVKKLNVGIVFQYNNEKSLKKKLIKLKSKVKLKAVLNQIKKIKYKSFSQKQISSYKQLLK